MYGHYHQQHHAYPYHQPSYGPHAIHEQISYGQQFYNTSEYEHNECCQPQNQHNDHRHNGQVPKNWYNPAHPTKRHKGNSNLATFTSQPSAGYAAYGPNAYSPQSGYFPSQSPPPYPAPPVPQPHVFHPTAPPWVPAPIPPPPPIWNGHQGPPYHQHQGYTHHRQSSSSHLVAPPQMPPPFQQPSHQPWAQSTPHPWSAPYGPHPPPIPPYSQTSFHQSISPPASHRAISMSASASSGYAGASRSQRSRNTSTAPTSEKPQSPCDDCDDMAWLDFEGNDYYADEDDQINQDLSLGTIIWKAPESVSKVMPALYKYADAWFADPPPRPDKDSKDGVSRYITAKNLVEHCLPAQTCKEWEHMRNDPIFRALDPKSRVIPLKDVMMGKTGLPTPDAKEGLHGIWMNNEALHGFEPVKSGVSYTSALNADRIGKNSPNTVSLESKPTQVDESEPMELEDDDDEAYSPPPIEPALLSKTNEDTRKNSVEPLLPHLHQPRKSNVVDVKAQAPPHASFKAPNIPDLGPPQFNNHERHSRTRSRSPMKLDPIAEHSPPKRPDIVVPTSGRDLTPKLPPQFARNEDQEDILARLGVTGAPKPVYATPGPAYMPRRGSFATDSTNPMKGQNDAMPPFMSALSGRPTPPPPPSPTKSEHPTLQSVIDPWGLMSSKGRSGTPNSITSQHTIAGSESLGLEAGYMEDLRSMKSNGDVERTPTKNTSPRTNSTDDDTTPKASEQRYKRKRSRTDSEEPYEDVRRQKDDDTMRLRKRAPKVAAVYGRRW